MNVLLCGGIRKHHEFLYKAGYDVTWLIARNNQFAEDLKSQQRRSYLYAPDDSIENVLAVAIKLHEIYSFQRVFSFHDDSQELAIRIGNAIGCAFPFGLDCLNNTRQKPLMRQRLKDASLASCWSAVANNDAALLHILAKSEFNKVIIKPVDGTGSLSVVALEAPASVSAEWVQQHVPNFPVLVEEFMYGREYSVESFTAQGVHYFAGVTEKFIDATTFVETGHVFPAELSPQQTRAITEYVASALTALGVDNTPAHSEVMLTAGGPRLIETHTRVGGDWIPTLVHEVTGIDLYELSVRIQENSAWNGAQEIFTQSSNNGYCGICYTLPPEAGKLIKSVSGQEQAKTMEGVLEVYLIRKPGDRTRPLTDSFARTAYVRAVRPSHQELMATLKSATTCIQYCYDDSPS